MEREVLLTGIGGQGVQLAAQVLARAAVAEGREVTLLGTYGGTMRGGNTDACLVAADAAIRTPPIVARAWAAIAMHDRFFAPTGAKLARGSLAFVERALFAADAIAALEARGVRVVAVDAGEVARGAQAPLAAALALAAAFCAATGFAGLEALVGAMRECVPSYRQQHVEANERALRAGFSLAEAGGATGAVGAVGGAAPRAWPVAAGAA